MSAEHHSRNDHPARMHAVAGFFRPYRGLLLAALLLPTACRKPPESPPDEPATTRSSQPRPEKTDDHPAVADPRTALMDAALMENPTERHKMIAAIALQVSADNPALAREALGMLPADAVDERTSVVRQIAMQMAHQDPEAALAWAESLESDLETALARSRIALVVADADPKRAATILAETDDAGREMEVAIVQVLQHWAAREPAAAADWLAMFPAADFRKAGMQTVMSRWLAADATAAMGWLAAMDHGEIRDEALLTTARVLSAQSQETRSQWLNAADETIRTAIGQASVTPP